MYSKNMSISTFKKVEYLNQIFDSIDVTPEIYNFLSMDKHIRFFSTKKFDEADDEEILFEIASPKYAFEVSQEDQYIKVGKIGIMIFCNNSTGDRQRYLLHFSLTEEEFFQDSLIRDYGPVTYDIILECKKLMNHLSVLR